MSHFRNMSGNIFKKRRSIGGLKAKQNGDMFEKILEINAHRSGYEIIDIPNGALWIGPNKIIPKKSPFDYVFVSPERCIFTDAKTIAQKTFPHSLIKPHQLKALKKIWAKGHRSGYVINFSILNLTAFFTADQLWQLQKGQSLGPDQGLVIGTNDRFDLNLI